jgi:ubiquinol-cytochrome c reductase iron-sulfur subunit
VNRPERPVAIALVASIAAAIGLTVVYATGGQPQLEGSLLFVALGGLGVALMLWARGLMRSIREETQDRHPPAVPTDVDSASAAVEEGVEEIRRRRFLSRLLLAAAGALGLAALFPVRSLGGSPGDDLVRTAWTRGSRLTTVDGDPVRLDTLELESFTTVFPEEAVGSSDAQAVLIRVDPTLLRLDEEQLAATVEGHVAYSKLCTHAGCPIGLYLAATHELRCPCHQSTFDVLRGAEPVYGPAARPLPQLPIDVDDEGYLRATGDFDAPAGPSFWNMPT